MSPSASFFAAPAGAADLLSPANLGKSSRTIQLSSIGHDAVLPDAAGGDQSMADPAGSRLVEIVDAGIG